MCFPWFVGLDAQDYIEPMFEALLASHEANLVVLGLDIQCGLLFGGIRQASTLDHWVALARQGQICGIVACPPRASAEALRR